MKKVNLCLLGASGAVGKEMLKVLEERKFPINELKLLGNKDAGKKAVFRNREYVIEKADGNSFKNMNITLVAVGGDISKKLTPEAVKSGSVVIDNSSAFRLDKNVPLVIPEVNPEDVKWHKGIIANPNCTTIIALVALAPLHRYAKIKRIIASTYQAVSGAGKEAMEELEKQTRDYAECKKLKVSAFRYQISFNLIPQIDAFDKNGYTKEELKMTNEGRKILHAPDMQVSCTCVRVPVFRSHSESITIETDKKLTAKKARELLSKAKGVKVVDNPSRFKYPMPLDATDQDLVLVGRIREDISAKNSLTLWCSGDQIRKGAATNAVQIAELILPTITINEKNQTKFKKNKSY